ncbi:MAG: hypothetical protein L6Q92_12875 [Phycisphaerae bacterium]|nr:hypothetical protein [Phycisphaerae bacterium]
MKTQHAVRALAGLALTLAVVGCHEPTVWPYTGPRVYLIQGTDKERSDGLAPVRDALLEHEINAAIYSPDDWLKIVIDIDKDPDEEAILVGHGHGAFLCTQVVRHYAQHHKTKFIKRVITVDAFNKDWPHRCEMRPGAKNQVPPEPMPIGHNAQFVHNVIQRTPGSAWGTDIVSTRNSNVAEEHPYYWYDNYWYTRPFTGQPIAATDLTSKGVDHETIDNDRALVDRILTLCRQAALSPFHYTPLEHHPHGEASRSKQPANRGTKAARG